MRESAQWREWEWMEEIFIVDLQKKTAMDKAE
jgi:hypothetical protein